MEVSSSRHKDNSGQSNLRYKLSIIASWFLQFMLKTEEDFHCGENNIQQLRTKKPDYDFLNFAPFYLGRFQWFRSRLGLPHRLQVSSDVEVTSGGLDDVIDGEAFTDFGQGHAGVLVDLEDALKPKAISGHTDVSSKVIVCFQDKWLLQSIQIVLIHRNFLVHNSLECNGWFSCPMTHWLKGFYQLVF